MRHVRYFVVPHFLSDMHHWIAPQIVIMYKPEKHRCIYVFLLSGNT